SPLSFSIHSDYLQIEGYVPQPYESMEISRAIVGPNYFRTLRTSVISGREFTAADTAESQLVAVVNQAFVDRYWPGANALGKQVRSEEHTSELQSRFDLVCRLLLEKKNKKTPINYASISGLLFSTPASQPCPETVT